MMKHKVYVKRQRQGLGDKTVMSQCRRVIKATLQEEGVEVPCEVSVLVTDDSGIQEINAEYRQMDKPTDVLSFPNFVFEPGAFHVSPEQLDPDGFLHLGDIAISAERAAAQAAEYGHHVGREVAYLITHATLHLLGYDHETEADKAPMRAREEYILDSLGLNR